MEKGNKSEKGSAMKKEKINWCSDCRDGEHENIDDNVRLVTVKDPGTGKLRKRSWMCENHREMYRDDGYVIYGD